MCAVRGLVQQRVAPCSLPVAAKQHVMRQLARPAWPSFPQPVWGLPALRPRKQPFSSRWTHHGPCHAAAETAAVSQGPGSNPSGTSSSSPGIQPPGPSVQSSSAGSSPQAAASGSLNSAANGGSSTNPSPVPGSAGTGAAGAAAGSSSSAPGFPGGAAQEVPFSLKPVYVLIFTLLFLGGLLFASMSLQLTSDMGFRDALTKVIRRIFRCGVHCCMQQPFVLHTYWRFGVFAWCKSRSSCCAAVTHSKAGSVASTCCACSAQCGCDRGSHISSCGQTHFTSSDRHSVCMLNIPMASRQCL